MTRDRRGRIAGLDALRGCAAISVFICHVAAYWPALHLPHHLLSLSQVGAHGVDVFVVLSGFALMAPLVHGEHLRPRTFLMRRLLRILPPYWVALALAAALAMGPLWHKVVAARASWGDLTVHVFGLQTWVPHTLGTINGSLWSISLELMLYLSFPILILGIRRVGLGAILASVVIIAGLWDVAGGDAHALPQRLVQFVTGMALATVLVLRIERRGTLDGDRVPSTLLALVAGMAATVLSTLNAPEFFVIVAWGLAGASFIWAFTAWAAHLSALDEVGKRSFSFYLVHQPVVLLLGSATASIDISCYVLGTVGAVAALLITAVAAEVLYRAVELPSHRYARRKYPGVTDAAPLGSPDASSASASVLPPEGATP